MLTQRLAEVYSPTLPSLNNALILRPWMCLSSREKGWPTTTPTPVSPPLEVKHVFHLWYDCSASSLLVSLNAVTYFYSQARNEFEDLPVKSGDAVASLRSHEAGSGASMFV